MTIEPLRKIIDILNVLCSKTIEVDDKVLLLTLLDKSLNWIEDCINDSILFGE